jgi:hypothetical protein
MPFVPRTIAPTNECMFSSGFEGVQHLARFTMNRHVFVNVEINRHDGGRLFNRLYTRRESITDLRRKS